MSEDDYVPEGLDGVEANVVGQKHQRHHNNPHRVEKNQNLYLFRGCQFI
jgi:hypothetical protein